MSKRTATDLNTKPTTTERLTCALKNSIFLPDGCCYLNDTGNKINFRISWRWKNHVCHVACFWGFSTATTAMSGKEQILLLRFFTATNRAFRSTFGRALSMAFWMGLYPYSSLRGFAGCSWRKCYQNCWRKSPCHSGETCASSKAGLGLISHSGARKSHRRLQQSLDWTGRAGGLASQVTGPHIIGHLPMGIHENLNVIIASWLWRKSYFPYRWGSNNHPAKTWHFLEHTKICTASLSSLYWGRWPHVWTPALNW